MVVAAEGPATEGSAATLHYRSNVGLHLRFEVRITRSDAPRELRWVGSRLGVSGEHYFQLTAQGSGTHFVHGEVFRGPFAGAMGFLFRGQVPVFEAFNRALRDVSEQRIKMAGAAPTGGTGRAQP